jgi:hypothetical protein
LQNTDRAVDAPHVASPRSELQGQLRPLGQPPAPCTLGENLECLLLLQRLEQAQERQMLGSERGQLLQQGMRRRLSELALGAKEVRAPLEPPRRSRSSELDPETLKEYLPSSASVIAASLHRSSTARWNEESRKAIRSAGPIP